MQLKAVPEEPVGRRGRDTMSIISSMIGKALRGRRHKEEIRRELKDTTARFPALAALLETRAASWELLAEPHGEYCSTVSSPVFAISPQTAAVMHALCTLLRPQRVLDLGSGFSSFALRRYCRDENGSCTVHTVDDDAQWLERTRGFLVKHGLPTDGTYVWNSFQEQAGPPYDLILHDMGRMNTRLDTLPRVLGLARADGLVVLDDMHKTEYAPHAVERCSSAGFVVCPLPGMTLDPMGRYAAFAFRPRTRL